MKPASRAKAAMPSKPAPKPAGKHPPAQQANAQRKVNGPGYSKKSGV